MEDSPTPDKNPKPSTSGRVLTKKGNLTHSMPHSDDEKSKKTGGKRELNRSSTRLTPPAKTGWKEGEVCGESELPDYDDIANPIKDANSDNEVEIVGKKEAEVQIEEVITSIEAVKLQAPESYAGKAKKESFPHELFVYRGKDGNELFNEEQWDAFYSPLAQLLL